MASETLFPNMRYPAVPLIAKMTEAMNCDVVVEHDWRSAYEALPGVETIRAHESPVDDAVKLFRRLHVDGKTGNDSVSSEPCDQQSEASQKVVVFHLRAQVGMNGMKDTPRRGVLGEPVDEQDDDQEERGEEGDQGRDREEMKRQERRRSHDKEADNLPSVRGKVTQESFERVTEQDDPRDGQGEQFAAEAKGCIAQPTVVERVCRGLQCDSQYVDP